MTLGMTEFVRYVRRITVAISLVLIGACDDSGQPLSAIDPNSTLPPPVAEVQISQAQLLMATIGTSQTISAAPVDALGVQVDAIVEWQSLDPQVASVDSTGSITAFGIGTTDILAVVPAAAHAGGVDVVAKLTVSVVDLAADVTLVPAEVIAANIELLSPPPIDSSIPLLVQARLLSSAPVVNVGDRLLASDWSFFGDVKDVIADAGDVVVTMESAGLSGFFVNAHLRFESSLADFEFPGDSGGESAFAKGASPVAALSQSSTASNIDFEALVGELFVGYETKIKTFSCKPSAEASADTVTTDIFYDVDVLDLDPVHEQAVVGGIVQNAQFYYDTRFRVFLNGTFEWSASFAGSLDCKVIIKAPFVQSGPLVISLPLGIGITLEGTAESTLTRATFDGYFEVNAKIGMEYSLAELVEPIVEISQNFDNLDVNYILPDIIDFGDDRAAARLDVYGFAIPRVGFGIGNNFGIYKKVDDFRLGGRLLTDVSGELRQARDDEFAAAATLGAFAKRTQDDPLFLLQTNLVLVFPALTAQALDSLGVIDLEELFSYEIEVPLYSSPKGLIVASTAEATVGDEVTFELDLTDQEFLGVYQVDHVVVHRLTGSTLSPVIEEEEIFLPAGEQTHFEWTWTPTESDAEELDVRFVPFVVSTFFPGTSFQLDDVLEISVVPDDEIPVTSITEEYDVTNGVYVFESGGSVLYDVTLQDERELAFNISQGTTVNGNDTFRFETDASSAGNELIVSFEFVAGPESCARSRTRLSTTYRYEATDVPTGTVIAPALMLVTPATYPLSTDGIANADVDINVGLSLSDDSDDNRSFVRGEASYSFDIYAEDQAQWNANDDLAGFSGGGMEIPVTPITVTDGRRVSFNVGLDVDADMQLLCQQGDSRSFSGNARLIISGTVAP